MKPEDITSQEWADWYRLTPQERFAESMKLRARYLAMGGSLEPEVDLQSPFYSREEWCEFTERARRERDRRVVSIQSMSGL